MVIQITGEGQGIQVHQGQVRSLVGHHEDEIGTDETGTACDQKIFQITPRTFFLILL